VRNGWSQQYNCDGKCQNEELGILFKSSAPMGLVGCHTEGLNSCKGKWQVDMYKSYCCMADVVVKQSPV
ncbi:hypothetical protein PROVALCAL_01414, partial [Providencia alcalifaciens DSM 30120]